MLKLCRVTKVKVFFLVLVYVFNFDLFEFPAAILEKGLFIAQTIETWQANSSTGNTPIAKVIKVFFRDNSSFPVLTHLISRC